MTSNGVMNLPEDFHRRAAELLEYIENGMTYGLGAISLATIKMALQKCTADETTESQVMLYELLSSARAELPDPDFVPDEDREIRLRKLRERIDAYLSVTDYMKLRSAVEPSELPEALRDPVKNLERGRELLKEWGPTPVTDAALAESKESPLARAVRIARGDTGPPPEPVRFAEKASEPFEKHPDYCMAHGGHLVDSPACKLAREREKRTENGSPVTTENDNG